MTGHVIPPAALNALLPLHLVHDAAGRITHAGPMTLRVTPDIVGRHLADAMTIQGSPGTIDVEALRRLAFRRLQVTLLPPRRRGGDGGGARRARGQRIKAMAIPLAGGGGLVAGSFGVNAPEAIARHRLCANDFGPADLSMEILFLLEAQTAVLGEAHGLIARLGEARDAAEVQAETDRLTGLRNRRGLERTLRRLTAAGAPPFTLMLLDLDHFKPINDTLGHAAGDHVLQHVARVLRDVVRDDDLVARIGGDEFVLLIEGPSDEAALDAIAGRVLERLARPIRFGAEARSVSASIGVARSALYARPDGTRMMADADAALYRGKRAGRGRVVHVAPDDASRHDGAAA